MSFELPVVDAVDNDEAGVVTNDDLVEYASIGRIVAFEDVGQLGDVGGRLACLATGVGDRVLAARKEQEKSEDDM